MEGSRQRRWVWLVVLGSLLAFAGVLGPEQGLYFGDHGLVFRHRWFWVVEALGRGALPVRTLASLSGTPLESLLNATYTPMTGLLWLGDFDFAYDIFVAGHVVLLGLGAFGLARALGATGVEAAGAASVALMGPVLSFENLLVGLQGLAWAPFVWWAALCTLRRPGLLSACGLAFAGGFHLQAIMPETAMLDVIAGGALIGVLALRGQLERPAASLLTVMGGLTLAVGVAAMELFPVLEALGSTRRGAGFSYVEQAAWSMHPLQLLDFVAPGLTSLHELPFAEPSGVFDGERRAYLVSLYLGTAPVIGAVALLDTRTRRSAALLWLVFGFGLLMALGANTPVHGALAQLPLLRSGRYPVKFLIVNSAALAGLVALGLRVLTVHLRGALLLAGLYLAVSAGLVSTLAIEEVAGFVEGLYANNRHFSVLGPQARLGLVMAQLETRAELGLWASSASFLVLLAASFGRGARWAAPACALTLWGGLVAGAWTTISAAPTAPHMPPEMRDALEGSSHRVYVALPEGRPPALVPQPQRGLLEENILADRLRGGHILPEVRRWLDYDADGQSLPISRMAFGLLRGASGPSADRLLGRLGVQWVSQWKDLPRPGKVKVPLTPQPPQYLYRLPRVRPPVSVHPRWARLGDEVQPGAELQRFLLAESTFEVVLVAGEQAPAPVLTSTTVAARCSAAATVVAPEQTRGDHLEIEVEAPCPVMLLVLEAWAPQWKARVDGAPAPVLQGEVGALAVAVPEGRHEVVLRFESRTRRWLPVSVSASLIAVLLAGLGLWRRRTRTGA